MTNKIALQHLVEKDGVQTFIIDLSLLSCSMVEKMHVLKQLRKSFEGGSTYFQFDEETEAYFEENEEAFENELSKEKKYFREFRELVLNEAVRPLYDYVDRQAEIVSAVYRQKDKFERIKDFRVPAIMYKVTYLHGDMILNINNKDELATFSKSVIRDFVGYTLEFLDMEYATRHNKTVERLHSSHTSLRTLAYAGDGVKVEPVVNYKGNDAILTMLIQFGLRKLENPSRILKMVQVIEKSKTM